MGTELMRVCVKEENDDVPSVPPGFESFAAFALKRVPDVQKQEVQNTISCSPAASASESQSVHMDVDCDSCDAVKSLRSIRRRCFTNYGQFEDSSEDESDPGKLDQNHTLSSQLPKGVIRGCPQCSNCQKVTARWHLECACRPNLEDVPVFHPTEEEFEDTLKYMASIRLKAEQYGICRIIPPPSWKPPCPLKEQNRWEGSRFATRVQRVDKLQNRDSMQKMSKMHHNTKKKRKRCMRVAADSGSTSGSTGDGVCAETFGFEPGPEFTLKMFEKYADDFKAQYFSKNDCISNKGTNVTTLQDDWEPTVENIEGEYWRIVEKATEEIEVLYGADLDTGAFGSGFPKKSDPIGSTTDEKYTKSGWNLNNFPRLPGSVLAYESDDISGVLVPWLYIGMCFSSFCWHVEDHHLYSLNYLHWGAPKLWYGVPGKDAVKLEETMRKHLPDLFEEQPDLLHKLVTQLSPSLLKSEGVPIYRCVQNAGEFVLTFPRAYHSGFNCGFNCAEAVNVAPVDWLPHGQIAIELYRDQGRRTSISHDKLLLGAAREAVRAHWEINLLKKNTSDNLRWKDVCGEDGILAKALKTRVEMERVRREFLCKSSQALKMQSNFDATSERECSICLFDLHLSAAGCHCSPDKYACLNHAKHLCSCAGNTKFFLFRYNVSELNILVEALEGKLSAVYRWARLDLGLSLSSYVSKDNLRDVKLSYSPEILAIKELGPQSSADSTKDLPGKRTSRDVTVTSSSVLAGTFLEEKKTPVDAAVSKGLKFHGSLQETKKQNHNPKFIKEEANLVSTNLSTSCCHFSREDALYSSDLTSQGCRVKKSSTGGHENIIVLSDDEGGEPKKPILERAKENSFARNLELPLKPSSSLDSPCNDKRDLVLAAPVSDARIKSKYDVNSSPNRQTSHLLTHPKQEKDECLEHSGTVPTTQWESHGKVEDSLTGSANSKEQCMESAGSQHQQSHGSVRPSNEDMLGVNATSNSVDNSRNVAVPSCSQNNLDRYFRQKGPRIAKVVRRINCNVEPLEYGTVVPGKLWCNSQTIFPKGMLHVVFCSPVGK
uniref:Putative lysine-specific demethylase JMJ16 n=1 Tax=Rhizophora mucronata TaxID=61149 RepID=A0A2P2KJE7_RHIMU